MFVLVFSALSIGQSGAFAVSSPSLGAAGNYGILASTLTNTATGVSVAGDVGYTNPPGVAAQVNGTLFVNSGTYQQAGTDQGAALSTLNALSCTQNFITAIDLAATNSTNQPVGHYVPGVYCTTGAQSVGTAGIVLDGPGTYVFRSSGALNTFANSHMTLINGANASDIFWTPVATTLGTTSNFTGTVIDPAGITLGTDVTWLGRALAFGNTVTVDANDKITVPGFVPQVTLTSITIQTPATKLSYTVGDLINTAGLVINGTFSNGTHLIVTPTSVTGFNSATPVTGQVLTVHVGTVTTTYTVNIVAAIPVTSNLGTAGTYVILSGSVITNGVPNLLVTGNTGHVSTLSAPFTYINGSDHVGAGTVGDLVTLGTPLGDQHAQLANIGTWDGSTNTGFACTFTFANGAINLATDTTHGHIGQYAPGVYCIDGAASIGTAGITLNATGTYVFKMNGALTSVSGSTVSLANGATLNNVFWAPVGGASLGANTQFSGTILSGAAAITTGANDIIQGRLISESAVTIGAGANTFTVPSGSTSTPTPLYVTALLTVYNARADLQAAFPQAANGDLSRLLPWAGAYGILDSASRSQLAPYAADYKLMQLYYARADLQAAFPQAANAADLSSLLPWAGAYGILDSASSPLLAPHAADYKLMQLYYARADLQAAFPSAATGSLSSLLPWAGAYGILDSSSSSLLVSHAADYKLMQLYYARADLKAAFPSASNAADLSSLLPWAGAFGITDSSSSSMLAPHAVVYKLMQLYYARADLKAAFPEAANAGVQTNIFAWAFNFGTHFGIDPNATPFIGTNPSLYATAP